jgi:hypothetical protein
VTSFPHSIVAIPHDRNKSSLPTLTVLL